MGKLSKRKNSKRMSPYTVPWIKPVTRSETNFLGLISNSKESINSIFNPILIQRLHSRNPRKIITRQCVNDPIKSKLDSDIPNYVEQEHVRSNSSTRHGAKKIPTTLKRKNTPKGVKAEISCSRSIKIRKKQYGVPANSRPRSSERKYGTTLKRKSSPKGVKTERFRSRSTKMIKKQEDVPSYSRTRSSERMFPTTLKRKSSLKDVKDEISRFRSIKIRKKQEDVPPNSRARFSKEKNTTTLKGKSTSKGVEAERSHSRSTKIRKKQDVLPNSRARCNEMKNTTTLKRKSTPKDVKAETSRSRSTKIRRKEEEVVHNSRTRLSAKKNPTTLKRKNNPKRVDFQKSVARSEKKRCLKKKDNGGEVCHNPKEGRNIAEIRKRNTKIIQLKEHESEPHEKGKGCEMRDKKVQFEEIEKLENTSHSLNIDNRHQNNRSIRITAEVSCPESAEHYREMYYSLCQNCSKGHVVTDWIDNTVQKVSSFISENLTNSLENG